MRNYKVFVNNSLFFFGKRQGTPPLNYSWSDFQTLNSGEFQKIVDKIKSFEETGSFIIETENSEKDFKNFASYFNVLQAAGGLVLNKHDEILMIHRFDRWDFPKGHIEKGEEIEDCAIREVMEETGLQNVSITNSLPRVYHVYDYSNKWILKETIWYLMFSDYTGILKPQLEESIVAAKWVPIDFLAEYISDSYLGLQQLVSDSGLLR